jgi:hypothetical protein
MAWARSSVHDGLGTIVSPFYAHRHIDFQKELSHETLAQRGPPHSLRPLRSCRYRNLLVMSRWNQVAGHLPTVTMALTGRLRPNPPLPR